MVAGDSDTEKNSRGFCGEIKGQNKQCGAECEIYFGKRGSFHFAETGSYHFAPTNNFWAL